MNTTILCIFEMLLCFSALRAEEPVSLEPGEIELSAKDSDVALRGIAERFKAHPIIRAEIISEVEDLVGKRVEEGELLMERTPGKAPRVLRKFTKPSNKIWLLDGPLLSEYSQSRKIVNVKDLSGAPKLLKQIQAAMIGDIQALEPLFAVRVFSKPNQAGALLRLVLDKKTGAAKRLYKRIVARIAADGIFFDELKYIPDEGDELTEKFVNIKDVPQLDDTKFALPSGNDIEHKVERVEE